MVEKFCSFEASKENTEKENYSYYFIKRGGEDIGYTAAKPDGERLFLSKLYLKKEDRGKKYARRVMDIYKDICRSEGYRAVHLTVNRHNENTIAAYRALGFVITGEGVTDIGGGYVMDDFYMELKI
ncbi:MAG: GNAT family N-acetyltransferase [Ruminococcus sp.]|nr:GNAT family N-acetyltransferase [Ruminococcus sp.]